MSSVKCEPNSLTLTLAADSLHIRKTLQKMMEFLATSDATNAYMTGDAEIVLAEILNNIAEHAFERDVDLLTLHEQMDCETIKLQLSVEGDRICGRVTDCGRPLPGHSLPERKEAFVAQDIASLPEGGFGWALIHDLTETISYYRSSSENVLEFVIASETARVA